MFFQPLLLKSLAGVGALAAAGTVGVAHASTPGHPNAATRPGHAAAAKGHALMRHLEHGEVTVATKNGDKTYDLQRGTVASVDGSSLEVTSKDGFAGDYTITDTTKVRVGGKPGEIGSLTVGEHVVVLASDGRALRVREPATTPRPDRAGGAGAPGATSPDTTASTD